MTVKRLEILMSVRAVSLSFNVLFDSFRLGPDFTQARDQASMIEVNIVFS